MGSIKEYRLAEYFAYRWYGGCLSIEMLVADNLFRVLRIVARHRNSFSGKCGVDLEIATIQTSCNLKCCSIAYINSDMSL